MNTDASVPQDLTDPGLYQRYLGLRDSGGTVADDWQLERLDAQALWWQVRELLASYPGLEGFEMEDVSDKDDNWKQAARDGISITALEGNGAEALGVLWRVEDLIRAYAEHQPEGFRDLMEACPTCRRGEMAHWVWGDGLFGGHWQSTMASQALDLALPCPTKAGSGPRL